MPRTSIFAICLPLLSRVWLWLVAAPARVGSWLDCVLKIAWPSPLASELRLAPPSITVQPSERQRVLDYIERRAARLERPTFAAGTGLRLAA